MGLETLVGPIDLKFELKIGAIWLDDLGYVKFIPIKRLILPNPSSKVFAAQIDLNTTRF